MFRFASPLLLLVALPLLALLLLRWVSKRRRPTFDCTLVDDVLQTGSGFWSWIVRLLPAIEVLAILLLIGGLARPQSGLTETDVTTEGIDIVLCVDTSGSMLAEDFSESLKRRKNRLEVAKDTMGSFIRGRRSDRIGLVVFSEAAYTKVPLTLDYPLLLQMLKSVEIDRKSGKTAIGMSLATAVNRLQHSDAESRVAILLTDGRNNAGIISPMDAADLAAKMGVKVYTIGVGRKGPVPFPQEDPIFGTTYTLMRVDIDEDTLLDIAKRTDGMYFRAEDLNTLREVFDTIDELETTEMIVREYSRYEELAVWFVLPGLALLAFRSLLSATRLRTLP